MSAPSASVVAVSSDSGHRFCKQPCERITCLAGVGVQGDAHAGEKVQHRSRVQADPEQPNLRQVHLLASELLAEWRARGFAIEPGEFGENILTVGIDLMALPEGTRIRAGAGVVLRVTGLRNPCAQIEAFRPGLLAQVVWSDEQGRTVRRAGIMSVVERGGHLFPGDPLRVELPPRPHRPLERV